MREVSVAERSAPRRLKETRALVPLIQLAIDMEMKGDRRLRGKGCQAETENQMRRKIASSDDG